MSTIIDSSIRTWTYHSNIYAFRSNNRMIRYFKQIVAQIKTVGHINYRPVYINELTIFHRMHRRVVGRAGERFVQPLNSATNIWYVFNNINKLRPRQSCMCDEYDWNLVVCRHNKNNQFLEKLTTTNCNEAAQINRIIIILIDWWKCIRTEQIHFPLSLSLYVCVSRLKTHEIMNFSMKNLSTINETVSCSCVCVFSL